MKKVKGYFNNIVMISMCEDVLYGAFGLFLILNPVAVETFFVRVLGFLLLISSLFSFIRFFYKKICSTIFNVSFFNGIWKLLLAVAVMVKPDLIEDFLVIAFGLCLFANGLIKLYYAFKFYNNQEKIWSLIGTMSVGLLAMSVALIVNPFPIGVLLTRVAGVFAMCFAILDGMQWLLFKKRNTEILKLFK